MYFYSPTVIVLFWSLTPTSSYKIQPEMKQDNLTCVTSNNESGICIPIRDCPDLYYVPYVEIFLRRSKCGKEENSQKVCCKIPVSSNFECGKSTNAVSLTRIVEGTDAEWGDWPWMVAFGYRTSSDPGPDFYCSGSLISNEWVISAAHCFVKIKERILTVARFGVLNLNDPVREGALPIDVSVNDLEIFPHPQYSPITVQNDIALIRLKKPLNFSELIHPICLLTEEKHTKDEFYANEDLYVAGWGHTAPDGSPSDVLKKARISIMDREKCSAKYNSLNYVKTPIDDRVLCAGLRGTDSCQGDSGGPLMVRIKNNYFLAGIVSFGYKCASSFPGVYTNVAKFSDWIKRTTKIQF